MNKCWHLDKNFQQTRNTRELPQPLKGIYEKSTNIILECRTKQEYLLSSLLFNIVLEFLANVTGKKKMKGIWSWKEDEKMFLFIDNTNIYGENPTESMGGKKLLELTSKFRKDTGSVY